MDAAAAYGSAVMISPATHVVGVLGPIPAFSLVERVRLHVSHLATGDVIFQAGLAGSDEVTIAALMAAQRLFPRGGVGLNGLEGARFVLRASQSSYEYDFGPIGAVSSGPAWFVVGFDQVSGTSIGVGFWGFVEWRAQAQLLGVLATER